MKKKSNAAQVESNESIPPESGTQFENETGYEAPVDAVVDAPKKVRKTRTPRVAKRVPCVTRHLIKVGDVVWLGEGRGIATKSTTLEDAAVRVQFDADGSEEMVDIINIDVERK